MFNYIMDDIWAEIMKKFESITPEAGKKVTVALKMLEAHSRWKNS